MATREKTIEFWFPKLDATLVDDTDTTLTQITAYIPESSPVFKSVFVELVVADRGTAGAHVVRRQISLQLGAVGYSVVNNTNQISHSSENFLIPHSADFTSYFTTNWTGTSMTMDCKLHFDGHANGMNNPSVRVVITYEYDDTSATHIKTVMIPLDAPQTTRLASTKPASAIDVIPLLDTYLPEASKTIRQTTLVVQGNTDNTALTDVSYKTEIDTAGEDNSQLYEKGLQTASWCRWNTVVSFTSSATHDWFIWCNTVNYFSKQTAYLVVTYEFKGDSVATALTSGVDATTTTIPVTLATDLGTVPYVISVEAEDMHVTSVSVNDLTVVRGFNGTTAVAHDSGKTANPRVMNSLQLPMESSGSGARVNAADANRVFANLNIQELGTIRLDRCAGVLFWNHFNKIDGIKVRMGAETYITLDQLGTVIAGGNSCMIRDDSAFTFSRGDNILTMDTYQTDATDMTAGINGFFFVNYVSDQHSDGVGVHNRVITKGVKILGTGGNTRQEILSAVTIDLTGNDYYINSFCIEHKHSGHTTGIPSGWTIEVERLSGEDGGFHWLSFAERSQDADPEIGVRQTWNVNNNMFKRFKANSILEINPKRLDQATARRWRLSVTGLGSTHQSLYSHMLVHNITYQVAGNITGSGGGTVNLVLHRDRPEGAEALLETSRSGDGAYAFTWFDNTDKVKVTADDGTNTGTTLAQLAV